MDNPMLLDVPPVQVEVGQVWRAWEVYLTRDSATRSEVRRTVERRLRVVEVDGVRALLENVETGRRTRIALARMRQTAATRGFELEE